MYLISVVQFLKANTHQLWVFCGFVKQSSISPTVSSHRNMLPSFAKGLSIYSTNTLQIFSVAILGAFNHENLTPQK